MTPPSTLSAPAEAPASLLYSDLDAEFVTTRRILERVPDGKDDWRPHDKSMLLGKLATHVAQLPGFGISILTRDEFDGTKDRPPEPQIRSSAERVQFFDGLAKQLRPLVDSLTWEQAMSPWTFRFGERVILQGPRGKLLRSFVLTHMVHHRAQLGVYLRLLGIPIPGSYGPSADEPM